MPNTKLEQLRAVQPALRKLLGNLNSGVATIDLTGVELPGNQALIQAGSYSSPKTYGADSDSMLKMYGLQTRDTGADVVTFFLMRGTGAAALIADSALVENSATGSSYPKAMNGGQFHAGMTANAKLATAAGDSTAGMFGAWLKIYSAASCTLDSGSISAPVWLDNQHSAGTNNGSEYTIYSTTGGTVPDSWARLETTSSGWTALFSFGFGTGTGPVVTGATMVSTQGADPSEGIAVNVNGTTRYIPLMAAA